MNGSRTKPLRSKRGSVSIFMVMVFVCFITVTAVLFAGAKSAAGKSMADASLQLAGRSVLAEYDVRLLSDYGLLAFRDNEKRIEDAIKYYAEASLAPKDPWYAGFRSGKARTFSQDTTCDDITVSLAMYSLFDVENFEDQIRTAALPELISSLVLKNSRGGSAEKRTGREDGYGRVLRSKSVIGTLPSKEYKAGESFSIFNELADIPSIDEVFHTGTSILMTAEYILSVFGNHVEGSKEGHFFGNEAEYIIVGGLNDKSNYSGLNGVKIRLIGIRNLLNHVALISDPEKMAIVEEIALAAAAVTGETFYEGAKVATIEAWVAAETGNDLVLLEHGERVAVIKNPAQWATQNFADILIGWTGEWLETEPVYAADRTGLTYRDYLKILLFLLNRETKLFRMMDLMQINLKGTYNEDFLMREYYIGFRFDCIVDGDIYAYTEKY